MNAGLSRNLQGKNCVTGRTGDAQRTRMMWVREEGVGGRGIS